MNQWSTGNFKDSETICMILSGWIQDIIHLSEPIKLCNTRNPNTNVNYGI